MMSLSHACRWRDSHLDVVFTEMKALLVVASLVLGGLSLGGCTKIAGDYVGKLHESSTIRTVKDGRMVVSAEDVEKLGETFHVEQAGDKLKAVVRGCTIEFARKGKEADAVPGQSCKLSVKSYEGVAAVKGVLSREGRRLNAVLSLAPTEPGVDGSLVVVFSGTVR